MFAFPYFYYVIGYLTKGHYSEPVTGCSMHCTFANSGTIISKTELDTTFYFIISRLVTIFNCNIYIARAMSLISSFHNQFELVKTSYIELQRETKSRWPLKRLRSEPASRVRQNQNKTYLEWVSKFVQICPRQFQWILLTFILQKNKLPH